MRARKASKKPKNRIIVDIFHNNQRKALRHLNHNSARLIDAEGNTLLHLATQMNMLTLIKRLLSRYCANPFLPNLRGETPLSIAIKYQHTNLTNIINAFCSHEHFVAPSNLSNLLFTVLFQRKNEAARILLSYAARKNIPNELNKTHDVYGHTSLQLAVMRADIDTVRLLLEHGACPYQTNLFAANALSISVANDTPEITDLLLTSTAAPTNAIGAAMLLAVTLNDTALCQRLCIIAGKKIAAEAMILWTYENRNMLSLAIANRNPIIVNMLLNFGADPHHRVNYNQSAFGYACQLETDYFALLLIPYTNFSDTEIDNHVSELEQQKRSRLITALTNKKNNIIDERFLAYIKNQEAQHDKFTDSYNRIDSESLRLCHLCGEGQYGRVYSGKYNTTNVAIKALKINSSCDLPSTNEFMILTQLTLLNAPNVVRYHGINIQYHTPHTSVRIIMDYYPYSLSSLIDSKVFFYQPMLYQLMRGIANGVHFIHQINIIHCDIKSSNILVQYDHTPVLSDFGSAMTLCRNQDIISTAGWSAPEIRSESYTVKADIFSMVTVFWELYARKEPFEGKSREQINCAITNQERETIPSDCPEKIAHLITWGWQHKPQDRPTADEVINELDQWNNPTEPSLKLPPSP